MYARAADRVASSAYRNRHTIAKGARAAYRNAKRVPSVTRRAFTLAQVGNAD